jgi:flagellar hook-length control protein FliK
MTATLAPIQTPAPAIALSKQRGASGVNDDFDVALQNATRTETPRSLAASEDHRSSTASEAAAEESKSQGSTGTNDPNNPADALPHGETPTHAASSPATRTTGRTWTNEESAARELQGHVDVAQRASEELSGAMPTGAASSAAAQTATNTEAQPQPEAQTRSNARASSESSPKSGDSTATPSPRDAGASSAGATSLASGTASNSSGGERGSAKSSAQQDPAPAPADPSASTAASQGKAAVAAIPTQKDAPVAATARTASKPDAVATLDRLGSLPTAARTRETVTTSRLAQTPRSSSPMQLADAEHPVQGQALRGLTAALRQGGGTVTLKLNPEALGPLRVEVAVNASNVTARFGTSTAQAHDLLVAHTDTLRAALEARGLTVERIVIDPPATDRGGQPAATPDSTGSHGAGPWNGSTSSGQEGHQGDRSGHGRPDGAPTEPRAEPAGSILDDLDAAESAGFIEAHQIGAERLIRLRIDALA